MLSVSLILFFLSFIFLIITKLFVVLWQYLRPGEDSSMSLTLEEYLNHPIQEGFRLLHHEPPPNDNEIQFKSPISLVPTLRAIDLRDFNADWRNKMRLVGQPLVEVSKQVILSDVYRERSAAIVSWRWRQEYMREKDRFPCCLVSVIDQAIERGFKWLFVDIVSIDQDSKELDRLIIEFAHLYQSFPTLFNERAPVSSDGSVDATQLKQNLRRAWLAFEYTVSARTRGFSQVRDLIDLRLGCETQPSIEVISKTIKSILTGVQVKVKQGSKPLIDIPRALIKQDEYNLRSEVWSYYPVEEIASGIFSDDRNCEYMTDMVIICGLYNMLFGNLTKNQRTRLLKTIDVLSKHKLMAPYTGLLMLVLAGVSLRLKIEANAIDVYDRLMVPKGSVGFKFGRVFTFKMFGDTEELEIESKRNFSKGDMFYIKYKSVQAEISSVNGHLVLSPGCDKDFFELLQMLVDAGEFSSEQSESFFLNSTEEPGIMDSHLGLSYANAYTA